jgi:hypothetical protein
MQLNLKDKLNQYNITTVSKFAQFVFDILKPDTNDIYTHSQFQFDMATFGRNEKIDNNTKICFGCMATAAILELCPIEDISEYDKLRIDTIENSGEYILAGFESLVNAIRIFSFESIYNNLMSLLDADVWPNFLPEILTNTYRDNLIAYTNKQDIFYNGITNKREFMEFFEKNKHLEIIDTIRIFELSNNIS